MDPLEAHLQRQIEHSRDFFWHRVRWRAVARELPQTPFELTDVGAGIGLLGDLLARDFPQATYRFVEPIESLEQALEQRFGAAANARRSNAYDGSRYVTLLDVLEHQEDDRTFLADLIAKMDPGATLVLTVPALQRLWSRWDVALGHHRRYDKRSLAAAFADTPVQLRELSYLFPEMLPAAMVRRRRQRSDGASGDLDPDSAEFPDLPQPVNELLYGLGSGSERLRRVWPAGTSLLAVAQVGH